MHLTIEVVDSIPFECLYVLSQCIHSIHYVIFNLFKMALTMNSDAADFLPMAKNYLFRNQLTFRLRVFRDLLLDVCYATVVYKKDKIPARTQNYTAG
jgi:hypothetical protein